jgi:hypothetical protein
MAQLSRPYQIALATVALLGVVWAVALRGHGPGSSPSEPTPAKAPAPATSSAGSAGAASSTGAAAEAKAAAAPTPIYHGAAPGVEGLTRAIAKAHGAVATSQRNAQELQNKSGAASEEAQTPANSGASSSHAVHNSLTVVHKTVTHTTVHRTAAKTHEHVVRTTRGQSAPKTHSGHSAQQIAVEAELAHGKTVMLVFWDPKSSVSREVLLQAKALAGGSKGSVTVHAALANQVGLFGKITEVVHVYQTPTILIVNRQGVVSTLTGLTDVFSLRQAVSEARQAKS